MVTAGASGWPQGRLDRGHVLRKSGFWMKDTEEKDGAGEWWRRRLCVFGFKLRKDRLGGMGTWVLQRLELEAVTGSKHTGLSMIVKLPGWIIGWREEGGTQVLG